MRGRPAKEYDFISPTGEHVHIINLYQFCIQNGLLQGNMIRVHQGTTRYTSCKGWRKYK